MALTKQTNSRRRRHYIDRKVQGALARRLIFHWLTFIVVAMVIGFTLQALSDPFRPLGEHVRGLWWTQGPILLVLIFLLPVFVHDSVKLSNRFAGPIYSLKRTIRDIAEGQPAQRIKFRKHDFWHDLADDFNTMVERLSKGDVEWDTSSQAAASQTAASQETDATPCESPSTNGQKPVEV